jgi:light-regulated signal transduction histidine kinase (bacteriophytochrome)
MIDLVVAHTHARSPTHFKFTAKTQHARIDVGSSDQDGERAFFIRDDGAGCDMSHADRLFAPFPRLHTQAEFPAAGSGSPPCSASSAATTDVSGQVPPSTTAPPSISRFGQPGKPALPTPGGET